jgi:hypothetical protein
VKGNRATRYPMPVIMRARQLRALGWSLEKVCDLLERESGVRPDRATVMRWCASPARAERLRKTALAGRLRREHSKPRTTFHRVSKEWKTARIRELADAGLSHAAIGIVAGVWWGERLPPATVRKRLGKEELVKRGPRMGVGAAIRSARNPKEGVASGS